MLKQPLIAIDIGTSAIKVVELGGGANKSLVAVGLEPCPTGAFADGQIKDPTLISSALGDMLASLRIRTALRRAVISLGGNAMIIKKIKVPNGPDADMSQQIAYEAEQQFQGDLANLYWDHSRLAREPDAAGNIPVVLAAAHRDMVETRLSILRDVGLRGAVVESDVFAAHNMFEYNYGATGTLIAVVNVGASSTSLVLTTGETYAFNREIGIGGDEYTRRLMDTLKIDQDNAESLKISVSLGAGRCPAEAQRVLNDTNEQLASEIMSSLNFFFQSGEAPPGMNRPAHVFLHGGGCRVLGLDAAVAATVQVPVHIVNPFQRVNVNSRQFPMDYLVSNGHMYGTAVGMALRHAHDNR